MALLAEPERISTSPWLARAYARGGFVDTRSFIITAGVVVILLLALSRILAVAVNYWRERYQFGVYERMSGRLLDYYLAKPYRFFLGQNTAALRSNILDEVMVLVTGSLAPLITLMINGGMALLIVLLLLVVSPGVAVGSALVFGGAYLLIYQWRKRPLARLGEARLAASRTRSRALEELLQGIKTVKTYGNEAHFVKQYRQATAVMARVMPRLLTIYQTPKYLLEVIAFCGIIGITLALYLQSDDLSQALPTLTLFAVAGYRLLPALQQVFGAYAILRANTAVVEQLYPDLRGSLAHTTAPPVKEEDLPFTEAIRAEALGFHFAGASTPLFQGLSLTIPKGQVVAFVGRTGSGKTTLVDLITGLLTPSAGQVTVDGKALTPATIRAWRNQLAYVPQHVFLYDASLRDNITFGYPWQVSDDEMQRILVMVDLHHFVTEEAADGLNTLLGENGVRLSGGQRQRVGLARALLRNPSVLILDEATSALDNLTEKNIINSLERLPAGLTVLIIAHRLTTVRRADQIYVLEKGKILGTGTYDALLAENERFRELAG